MRIFLDYKVNSKVKSIPVLFKVKKDCYGCSACYAICSKWLLT